MPNSNSHPLRLPLTTLLIGVVLAILVGLRIHSENQTQAATAFQALTNRTVSQIEKQLELYKLGLMGARSAVLVAGEDSIRRDQFLKYAQSRDFQAEFPGARGFGYIRRIKPAQENGLIEFGRKEIRPTFFIKQLTPHSDDRFVILFIEPEDKNTQAVGLDIASETARRTAAITAAESGKPTLSSPITLLQASEKNLGGFLFLMPIYRDNVALDTASERWDATTGWSYAPLVFDEIMANFDFRDDEFALRISDITDNFTHSAQNYFYSSPKSDSSPVLELIKTVPLNIGGRKWLVEIKALQTFKLHLNQTSPLTTSFAITLVSALFSGLIYFNLVSIQRRIQVNAEQTQKQSLRRIIEEKERLLAVIEQSPDYIGTSDLDGNLKYHNASALKMLGFDSVEALYKLKISDMHPAWAAKLILEEGIPTVLEKGIWESDTAIVTRSGQEIPVAQTILLHREENGEPSSLSTIMRDISERQQREEKLRELLAFQKAILDSAGYSVITTTPEGIITLFNPAAEKLLGYQANEIINKETPALIHDLDEVINRAHVLSAELHTSINVGFETFIAKAQLGHVDTNEWTYICKDKSRIPVLLSVSALRSDDGKIFGYLGIALDMTARKQQQVLLENARQSAENASKLKSEFLANMSHEIRTPMNGIIGMTALALKTELTERQREYLTMVQESSESLLRLINDILDFSKIEAGKLDMHAVQFDLREILGNTLRRVSTPAEQKGLELLLRITPSVPDYLFGDPDRLMQVITNLISNAIKFTGRGEILVSAELESVTDEYHRLHFSVKDTGIGIADDVQLTIFEAFSQADASTTRRYGGTGLGLSICKQLVDLMHGTLWVESATGKGSTFHFLAQFENKGSQKKNNKFFSEFASNPILIVDDNHTHLTILAEILDTWGLHTKQIDNGRDAINEFVNAQTAGIPYQLILLDHELPGMDGFAVATQLRQLTVTEAPIIMMVSSDGDKIGQERCESAGIKLYLKKPIHYNELLTAIKSSFEKNISASESNSLSEEFEPPTQYLKILLAEDHPVNQKLAASILQERGHRVKLADNGIRALDLFHQEKFDVILMDVQMPEMDGEAATAAIRLHELDTGKHIRIVAVTAHASTEDRQRLLQPNMADSYLTKPYFPEQLLEAAEGKPLERITKAKHVVPAVNRLENAPPCFIREEAMNRAMGQLDLLKKLALNFLENLPNAREELYSLQKSGEFDMLARAAHKFKGAAANFAAPECVRQAIQLEQACLNKDTTTINAALTQLNIEIDRLIIALNTLE